MARLLLLCCVLCLGSGGCQSAALTSAKLYLQQDEPVRAKEQLLLAVQNEPANPEVHFLLGTIHAREGNYAAMDSAFGHSLSLGPKFAKEIQEERYRYWAKEYNDGVRSASAETADYAAALTAFGRAVQVDSTRQESWRNLAFVYYHLDSLTAAVQAYQRVLALAPGDTSTHYSLGVLYLKQSAYAEALRTFTDFLRLKPDDADGLANQGYALMQLDRYGEAETSYRKAIAANPAAAQPHYNLGNLYWRQKSYAAAQEEYRQALALAPQDDDARYNLAVTCLALEQWDQALALLEELATRMPDSAGVWQGLGQVYAVKGRIEESKQAYAKADALAR